jgi:hypothetical protein
MAWYFALPRQMLYPTASQLYFYDDETKARKYLTI